MYIPQRLYNARIEQTKHWGLRKSSLENHSRGQGDSKTCFPKCRTLERPCEWSKQCKNKILPVSSAYIGGHCGPPSLLVFTRIALNIMY